MRELDLLAHIYKANPALPGSVVIPPGDDMGAVQIGTATVLSAVDQVADGVHFDLSETPLKKIGRKAITRNLSDVAAMAAKPVGAVAAVCLPGGFDQDRAKILFDAMRHTAEAFDCPLIGGDISTWDQRLILTVTVFAEPDGIEPVLRSGARVGDAIYVTGALGGSLQKEDDRPGDMHHLDFTPRLEVARTLAGHADTRPSAMIDLSDGLAQDLTRICEASGVYARLNCNALPASPRAHLASLMSGKPQWHHVVGDGEDYELCFTAPSGMIPTAINNVPITAIGTVVESGVKPCVTMVLPNGTTTDISDMGWEHRS